MIDELVLNELVVSVIADQHAFRFVGNSAFEADIGTCEGVITSDHDHANLSVLQLLDCSFRLRLQFVLEYFKTIEF